MAVGYVPRIMLIGLLTPYGETCVWSWKLEMFLCVLYKIISLIMLLVLTSLSIRCGSIHAIRALEGARLGAWAGRFGWGGSGALVWRTSLGLALS